MIINEVATGFETIIGIDIAKNSFQVYSVNQKTGKSVNYKCTRAKFTDYVVKLGTALIFMESCGSSQYWARELTKLGFTVKLIAAQHVKKFLNSKRVKNDMKDAVAIYTCGLQPDTKFVKVKTVEEQTIALIHTLRAGCVKQRVQLSNRIRAILSEFGIVVPTGRKAFEQELPRLMEQCETIANTELFTPIQKLFEEYHKCRDDEKAYDEQLSRMSKDNELTQIAMTCPGVGELTASAIVAEVGNGGQFRNAREMAAWAGLVPSQHSTGGRSTLGGITKNGNVYLRALFTQCAISVVKYAQMRFDAGTSTQLDIFALRLLGSGKAKLEVAIAVANKIVRTLWAMLTTRTKFKNYQGQEMMIKPVTEL